MVAEAKARTEHELSEEKARIARIQAEHDAREKSAKEAAEKLALEKKLASEKALAEAEAQRKIEAAHL